MFMEFLLFMFDSYQLLVYARMYDLVPCVIIYVPYMLALGNTRVMYSQRVYRILIKGLESHNHIMESYPGIEQG